MHISVTTLKRLCRRHGVKRWPHRQISGINRALADLEARQQRRGAAHGGGEALIAAELRQLQKKRQAIIEVRCGVVCGVLEATYKSTTVFFLMFLQNVSRLLYTCPTCE